MTPCHTMCIHHLWKRPDELGAPDSLLWNYPQMCQQSSWRSPMSHMSLLMASEFHDDDPIQSPQKIQPPFPREALGQRIPLKWFLLKSLKRDICPRKRRGTSVGKWPGPRCPSANRAWEAKFHAGRGKKRSDTPLKCFQTEILNKGLIFTDSSIKDG